MSKIVSTTGVALVKKWEGCRLEAYRDSVGVWTIGYGTIKYPNGTRVKAGDKITQLQAESYLKQQIQEHADGMKKYLDVSILNQNQYDALASFHYNLGKDILRGSSLLIYLKQKKWSKVSSEMLLYNKGRINGKLTVLKGLQNRRNAEVELFNTPVKNTVTKTQKNKKTTTTVKKKTTTTQNTYTVIKGDTLSHIAVKNNTTVAKLKTLNSIKDANKIYIGQKIKLK